MKFCINKLILWLKNGEIRTISFLNNKINVITGNSDTGKSSILDIVDYCLCSSKANIPNQHIGVNVLWYGINITINSKNFTIARGEIRNSKPSSEYFFSGSGEIPKIPYSSIATTELKTILEQEFSINDSVTFAYGGKNISQSTKISYRYFLMFNTQSGDTINDSQVYFDKQSDDRYREALPRIFDLALGITTVENMTLKSKIDNVQKALDKLEKEKALEETTNDDVKLSKQLLLKKAREYYLINSEEDDEVDFEKLKEIISSGKLDLVKYPDSSKYDALLEEHQKTELQIKKLNNFNKGYANYKKQLAKEKESLRPVEHLKKFIGNIENDEYKQFIIVLEKEYTQIKKMIVDKMPFETDISNKLSDLNLKLDDLKRQIALCPKIEFTPISESERYIALGEIKSEYTNLINKPKRNSNLDEKIKNKSKELEEYKSRYVDYESAREATINALNDCIASYMVLAKSAFESYEGYVPSYDYKRRILQLRKNKTNQIESRTSSSVDLFRHLCLFLGIHELSITNKVPYIAPLLILDQPTRPYFQTNKNINYTETKNNTDSKGDWNKVEEIFLILDEFVKNIQKSKSDIQVIVLEHVSSEAWEGRENVHLVEEFDGVHNALIPPRIANVK
ncbi:hypothetical protein DSECCO2_554890 [anaerobic digester metagenome]